MLGPISFFTRFGFTATLYSATKEEQRGERVVCRIRADRRLEVAGCSLPVMKGLRRKGRFLKEQSRASMHAGSYRAQPLPVEVEAHVWVVGENRHRD